MREDSLEEGRRWLQQALEDLHWAEDLAQRGGYYLACFLAQQVAEKALKAFLYTRGLEIVLGHSVERLYPDPLSEQRPRQHSCAGVYGRRSTQRPDPGEGCGSMGKRLHNDMTQQMNGACSPNTRMCPMPRHLGVSLRRQSLLGRPDGRGTLA